MKSVKKAVVFLLTTGLCTVSVFLSAQKDSVYTVIAHRGGPNGMYPENSFSAINSSLKAGAERIEVDVHQTKDSILVVIHDKTADRTTSGNGLIKDMSWDQLKKLDLDANEGLPLLEDVFSIINGSSCLVIEIKEGDEYYPGIEKRVAEMIRKHDAYNWCFIHSFKDEILEKVHEFDSAIVLQKLIFAKPFILPLFIDTRVRIKTFSHYDYVNEFSVNQYFAGRLLIKRVHRLGKKVNVWNVNSEKRKARLVRKGIDGIITDFP